MAVHGGRAFAVLNVSRMQYIYSALSLQIQTAILFTSNKMAALCSGWVVRCCSRTAIVERYLSFADLRGCVSFVAPSHVWKDAPKYSLAAQ